MGKKNLERRVYTKEFKVEAVALAEKKEKPISHVAKDLDINENVLRRWIQQARTAGNGIQAFPGHGKPRDEELARLRKENKALKNANEILKKRRSSRTFGTRNKRGIPVMAYEFIKKNKGKYAVKEMAGLLGLSRGAYYSWLGNGFSQRREKADAQLLSLIQEIFKDNHGRYGSSRVHKELRKRGIMVSLKKVAKMMRENGLRARTRQKFILATDSKHSLPVYENILNRDFHAEKPGQKWVSGITYLRTIGGWIYLTIILDLFDRKIIGWAFSSNMHTEKTTVAALETAVKNRTPEEDLIFHSDRGVQYCAQAFRDALREMCQAVRRSMSRKGNCWDNACAESFFGTLKKDVLEINGKHRSSEVRQAVL